MPAVVAKPDERWGETPRAFVELKPDKQASGDELMQWCRTHLAAFKCPRHVVFADVPKTSTGEDSEVQAAGDGESGLSH